MENATAGTVIGTLAATDADSGETLTYSIVGANTNFEVVGNQLRVRTGASLNFEAAPQHTLTVRVTDSANNTRDQLVTINVVNVNEAPIDTGVIGATNLVSNGSFESGLAGWTKTGGGVVHTTLLSRDRRYKFIRIQWSIVFKRRSAFAVHCYGCWYDLPAFVRLFFHRNWIGTTGISGSSA